MKRMRIWVILAVVFWSAPAVAQEGFDLQQFNPMPDQKGNFFSASSADVLPHMKWQGMGLFHYAHAPLVLKDEDGRRVEAVVNSQSTFNLLGAMGFADFFELGIDVPLVINGATDVSNVGEFAVPEGSVGIGDLRLVPKVSLFNTRAHGDASGYALAVIGDVFLPLGNSDAFQGGDLRGGLRLAFDVIAMGGMRLGANLGYLFRPQASLMNIDVNDAMTWALGAQVPLTAEFQLTGELFGKATFASSGIQREGMPTELLFGAKYHRGGLFAQAGAGGGLVNGRTMHGLIHPEMGHVRIPHDRTEDPYPGRCPFHG
ncbi:MAG: hypothetical protein ACNA8W_23895, partial [Bradymonadaceae bacterium]